MRSFLYIFLGLLFLSVGAYAQTDINLSNLDKIITERKALEGEIKKIDKQIKLQTNVASEGALSSVTSDESPLLFWVLSGKPLADYWARSAILESNQSYYLAKKDTLLLHQAVLKNLQLRLINKQVEVSAIITQLNSIQPDDAQSRQMLLKLLESYDEYLDTKTIYPKIMPVSGVIKDIKEQSINIHSFADSVIRAPFSGTIEYAGKLGQMGTVLVLKSDAGERLAVSGELIVEKPVGMELQQGDLIGKVLGETMLEISGSNLDNMIQYH